eukprot:1820230-Pleurochrysis_carterae.AAC.1
MAQSLSGKVNQCHTNFASNDSGWMEYSMYRDAPEGSHSNQEYARKGQHEEVEEMISKTCIVTFAL